MQAWWNNLSTLAQVFSVIAIPATIVMILQSLLLLFGIGFGHDVDIHMGDSDADMHDGASMHDGSDGLSLFTIRGMVAFFSVGGWSGVVATNCGLNQIMSIAIAFIAGFIALVGVAYIFMFALKMQQNGNLDIKNAISKVGTVYIPIPAKNMGHGQVTLTLQEQSVELNAISNSNEIIKTGTLIRVKDIIDQQTVLVECIEEKNKKENNGGISKWIVQ